MPGTVLGTKMNNNAYLQIALSSEINRYVIFIIQYIRPASGTCKGHYESTEEGNQ